MLFMLYILYSRAAGDVMLLSPTGTVGPGTGDIAPRPSVCMSVRLLFILYSRAPVDIIYVIYIMLYILCYVYYIPEPQLILFMLYILCYIYYVIYIILQSPR